jgi:hypothetical protein
MNIPSGYAIKRSRSSKKMLIALLTVLPIVFWIVNLFS